MRESNLFKIDEFFVLGISKLEILIPDKAIIIATGVLASAICTYLLFKMRKNTKKKEKCEYEFCENTPTNSESLNCSKLAVLGIIKLREGYVGVTKEKFFFFWNHKIYNKNILLLTLSNYEYYHVAPVLKALGKNSEHFEKYCRNNPTTHPKRVNKVLLNLINNFLKTKVKLHSFFSNTYCLECKNYWAQYLLQEKVELPNYSSVLNFIKNMK
jgi:hypothetical protein